MSCRWLPPLTALLPVALSCLTACTSTPAAQAGADEAVTAAPGSLSVGPLQDEAIRKAIYRGLEGKLNKAQAAGEGATETTELGDLEAFRFTVMKLTKGPDDVSGDPQERPDAIEVEVTGWYKRTLKSATDGATSLCNSFDTLVKVVKAPQADGTSADANEPPAAGDWSLPADQPVAFEREDAEDCY